VTKRAEDCGAKHVNKYQPGILTQQSQQLLDKRAARTYYISACGRET